MSVSINGTNGLTFNDGSTQATAATGFGFKNRIINGAMRIDQRNAGASVTPTNSQYLVDRWMATLTQSSKYTAQRNAGSVTPPAGFTNYLGITSTSAYAITSTDAFRISQQIEGFNIADLAWGTANAQAITVSFWVRSSLTGTFGAQILNGAATRAYPFTYTISAANTWEQKSVTVPGDTTGTWLTDNSSGMFLGFGLGYGSSLSGTANAWNAGTAFMPTGATSVVGTNGATFYITGVQLEKGSTATSFDYRPYGTELVLCQRYFWKSYNTSTAVGTATAQTGPFLNIGTNGSANTPFISVTLPVSMRASPTITTYSPTTGASGKIRVSTGVDVNGTSYRTTENAFLSGPAGTGGTTNEYEWHVTASIEL